MTGAGSGLAIGAGGKISAATVSANGLVTLAGVPAQFSSQDITVTLTPSWNATATTVIWSCEGGLPRGGSRRAALQYLTSPGSGRVTFFVTL